MRGDDPKAGPMYSYRMPEQRVPADHPLRAVRAMTERALVELDPLFNRLYARTGRPSVPPEQLLRALLLQLLYSVRSERLLMERLDYDLLFRWFVGLGPDDPVWDPTVFTKNRERLLRGEVAAAFFDAVLAQARERDLLSDEHFSVDGTLVEAWASHKSFRLKDPRDGGGGSGEGDFRGKPRRNDTHRSTTDPEARLYRKGNAQEAKLCYLGHVLMENRSGLAVAGTLTQATGYAEREAALALLREIRATRRPQATLGADRAYDTADFVRAVRAEGLTPHVAQNTTHRRSAIDGRTTHHPGYTQSGFARRRIERIFGWTKTIGLLRKTRHRGRARVGWMFTLGLAAHNLVRMRTLMPAT
jgi:transposase